MPDPLHVTPGRSRNRGTALIEFVLSLPLLLILVFGTIDFGHLVQERLIITNVSREGASIASREGMIDPSITSLLEASGAPLDLGGADGKLVVTRLAAGQSSADRDPKVAAQIVAGKLAVPSGYGEGRLKLGLTPKLYDHLVFRDNNATADIDGITVVEVFYKYRPITPLPRLVKGMLLSNGDGVILHSRAIF
jgi:hypothetical protein